MDDSEFEALVRQLHNRMRGRAAGFIEALNLDEKKERAIISHLKSLSYDCENTIVDAAYDR